MLTVFSVGESVSDDPPSLRGAAGSTIIWSLPTKSSKKAPNTGVAVGTQSPRGARRVKTTYVDVEAQRRTLMLPRTTLAEIACGRLRITNGIEAPPFQPAHWKANGKQ